MCALHDRRQRKQRGREREEEEKGKRKGIKRGRKEERI